MRIYISSTSMDLADYRRSVIAALQRSGHTPVCMEHHSAADVIPKDECLQEVAKCDLYVGIFAWRYGFVPQGCEYSITEMEYQEAEKLKKPTLAFLLDESVEWPAKCRDSGGSGRCIRELRAKLQQDKWVRFFTNPDNLATEVLSAIMREEFKKAAKVTPEEKELQITEVERLLEGQAKEKNERERKGRIRVPIPIPEKLIRHFQDRDAELSKLQQCLTDRHLKMVLICGRGGVGKTSLAAKFIRELENVRGEIPFGNGSVECIIYLSLGHSENCSPDRIVELLSRTMEHVPAMEMKEIWKQEDTPLQERLAKLFQGPLYHYRYLIVLDNLESVLDDDNRIAEEFAALRRFIDSLFEYDHAGLLIATSRRALSLSPDAEIAAIGRRMQIPLDEGLPEGYAVALLQELDRDGRLGVHSATREVLGNIVHRCQYIPRTLETLITTLLHHPTWTLDTLLENDQLLTQLVDNPARELYTSLSSDQERLIMQALAVYDKPVPGAAIHYILPALPIDEILDKFVRNFVATFDRGQFWLHPLDRQYAYSQVPDQGSDYSRPALHRLAAQFYRKLRKPVDAWKTLDDVKSQLDEFQHLVKAEYYDDACCLLNEIDREHMSTWGYSQEIIKMRSQLLGHIQDRELEGQNLGHLGSAHLDSGDMAKAREYYKHALEIARETQNRRNESRWLGNLGVVYNSLGDHRQARESLSAALDIAKKINDRLHENRWLGCLTGVLLNLKQVDVHEAMENYQKAIAIGHEVSDRRFEMIWYERLGNLSVHLGDLVTAKEQFHFSLEAARWIGAHAQTSRMLLQMGDVHERLGETSQQAEYYELACEVLGEIRSPVDKANVLIKLAAIYADLGQQQRQVKCYEEALQIVQDLGENAAELNLLLRLGDAWAQLGDRDKASNCYRRTLEKAHDTADRDNEIIALFRLASRSIELGCIKDAAGLYERALQIAREMGDRTNEAIILSAYANVLLNFGEARGAIKYYELALQIVSEMNDKVSQSLIVNRLGMAAYILQDVSKAIGYYQESLMIAREMEDRDSESVALFNIGDAHHLAGDVVRAIPYYKDALALEISSTAHKCALGLGVACLQMDKQQEAKSHFEHCISLLTDAPIDGLSFHPQLDALGVSLLAVGRTREGVEVFNRGLKLSPPKEYLYYAIQDLRLLQRVPQPIPGLSEVVGMLEGAFVLCTDAET